MVENQQVPKVFRIASEFVDKFAQRIDVIDQNGGSDKRRDMPGHFDAPFFNLPVIHFVQGFQRDIAEKPAKQQHCGYGHGEDLMVDAQVFQSFHGEVFTSVKMRRG